MYGYIMSVIICEIAALGVCFININTLSISQDIGILLIALALGLFIGVLANISF